MTGPLRPAVGRPGVWRQPTRMCCPCCGHNPDSFGHPGTGRARHPQSGDFSICFRCGEVGIIEISPIGVASIREANLEELAEFNNDPAKTDMVRQIHVANTRRPRTDP